MKYILMVILVFLTSLFFLDQKTKDYIEEHVKFLEKCEFSCGPVTDFKIYEKKCYCAVDGEWKLKELK